MEVDLLVDLSIVLVTTLCFYSFGWLFFNKFLFADYEVTNYVPQVSHRCLA